MSNEFEELQRKWQKNKQNIKNNPEATNKMLATITAKKKSNIRFHYGNISILSIVVLGVAAFFYYVAPVKEIASRIGVFLMIGSLFLRILIEYISILKSKKIDIIDSVLKTTNNTLTFYTFRKRIHGPVTVTIIALYTIGFYMITPEFSIYFSTWQMILIDSSYIIGAIIPFLIIRKSIKKEIRTLLEIIELRNEILEKNNYANEI
ncbi:hypothetical protein [Aquimarina muelleri]|uniref:Uncharacterized protein n=1 Tax=Aquimarina muelleri TaxID=279356 RepID=A0A918N2T9_9FLAO|nr:hypothetical protein [Aquimarina muelleri]MCX2763595.1 hypothetical protein [Aquimarina muelleri]GGX14651.1 hypothetical protein GCM10007384_15310 [Aquimarina muelleri]